MAEDVFGNASTADSSTVNLAITGGTGTSWGQSERVHRE